ncbi:hypothetical protein FRC08_008521 [Ceratobasidium sp. 394]|nr:hypothetical protein FRC08_008521 [Ceratobasidium sp. 394]KAG9094472.1 hypothetical protein FS749_012408 [Ceratobasidium sp. UAMH 11750]
MSTSSGLNKHAQEPNLSVAVAEHFTKLSAHQPNRCTPAQLNPFINDGFYHIVQLDSEGNQLHAALLDNSWVEEQNEYQVMMVETPRPAYRCWKLTREWGVNNGFTVVPVMLPTRGDQNLKLGATAIANGNKLRTKQSSHYPVWTIECAESVTYKESNETLTTIHCFRIFESGTNRCWKTNAESSVTVTERITGRPPASELFQLIPNVPQQILTVSSGEVVSAKASDPNLIRRYYFGAQISQVVRASRGFSVQLETDAHNQGWARFPDRPPKSWFELAVFSTVPPCGELVNPEHIKKGPDGAPLTWLSHRLKIDSAYTLQAGSVFTKDHDLWKNIGDEDYIGVLACAQSGGWLCEARGGKLYFEKPLFEARSI